VATEVPPNFITNTGIRPSLLSFRDGFTRAEAQVQDH
jgi:hypothetical protein